MTPQTTTDRDPPERVDRDHPAYSDVEDGGCWFCSRMVIDVDRAGYCREWGGFYHADCARRHDLDPHDGCPICRYEFGIEI